MPFNERTDNILSILKERGRATVEELAETLFVSDATIRRDLAELQTTGQVKRTHGGAIYVEKADEISIFIRQMKNSREKEHAASVALLHLPEFQTVFFDNSSTCLALAERMPLTNKTVVTNGLQIALQVARHEGVNTIIPGGEVRSNTSAVLGGMTASTLHNFRFDLSITSCSAIDADGTYEFSVESMQVKKTAMEQARIKMLIVDDTKFGTSAAFRTQTVDKYDIIITNADDKKLKIINPDGNLANIFNK